jgi:ssDNA-binding replication factor A large subunit
MPMQLSMLRPGMEEISLIVTLIRLDEPREVTTNYGFTHKILDGEVKDSTGTMNLSIWNEQIDKLKDICPGDTVKLIDCFITSFQGTLSINIGRESDIEKQED